MTVKIKFYVVLKGWRTGFFREWNGEDGAKAQVHGFPGAVYKSFRTLDEALAWHAISLTREPVTPSPANCSSVRMFADGACKGNPGGRGGWGVLIQQGAVSRELYGGVVDTTNNRMELTAVIEGLAALPFGSEVHVVTDSKYVQKGISEWIHNWKRRGWRTSDGSPVKNKDLWVRLDSEVGKHQVSWEWVRGHNGHTENERADALANMGVDSI